MATNLALQLQVIEPDTDLESLEVQLNGKESVG